MKHIYLISVLKSLELSSASSLKKHRSLEDLQTNGIREEEEDASNSTSQSASGEKKLSGKTSRACGANESFRAAIDRSYDPDKLENANATDAGMDTSLCLRSSIDAIVFLLLPKVYVQESGIISLGIHTL